MHQVVQIPAEHFFRSVADHFAGRPVDKSAIALQIDSVDALASGFQNQLHLLGGLISSFLGALAFSDVLRKIQNVVRFSCTVPNDRKPSIRNDQMTVTANES